MKNRFFRCMSLVALLAAPGWVSAQVQDNHLILNVDVGGTAPGFVDVLFRDFTNAGPLDDFEWIRPTIELQVSPSLTASQQLQSLYLNFTPDLDITKLRLYWTGSPMPPGKPGSDTFMNPGIEPSTIAIARNGIYAGGGQLFDIFMHWTTQPMTFSKLLLYYDDTNVDLTFADFNVKSSTAPFFTDPPFGPLLAAGAVAGPGGSGTIGAIPEPATFAMLALGLLVLGWAAWSRRTPS